nr:MAG TPA: MqsA [Caudoviricetes sp.]
MTCCDMCGKEIKSILDQRDVEIGNNIVVFVRKRTMCRKCSQKLKRFIKFEAARKESYGTNAKD